MKHHPGILLISTTLLFTACKKTDFAPTSIIVGSWKKSFTATDTNMNNVLEASEKTTATDYEVANFYSNGTFTDSLNDGNGMSVKFSGHYSLNGDWLTVTVPGFGSGTTKLIQLDTTTQIVQDTSRHPTEWTGYNRM
jgi:hypothetical protein